MHEFTSIAKKFQAVLLCFAVAGLLACGKEAEPLPVPVQHWQEMDVRIEPHPNPPVAGMSEVVVIVTGPRGRPIHDLIISLRSNDAMPWVQTIQDGHMGAYRRAVDLGNGDVSVLQVRLQRGESDKVLFFQLELTKD